MCSEKYNTKNVPLGIKCYHIYIYIKNALVEFYM